MRSGCFSQQYMVPRVGEPRKLNENTRYAWPGETFLCSLRKVPRAHSRSAWVLRNRHLEGTNDAQKTPREHPDFNFYIQNLRVFIFQTDERTETLIRGGFPHFVPPGKHRIHPLRVG